MSKTLLFIPKLESQYDQHHSSTCSVFDEGHNCNCYNNLFIKDNGVSVSKILYIEPKHCYFEGEKRERSDKKEVDNIKQSVSRFRDKIIYNFYNQEHLDFLTLTFGQRQGVLSDYDLAHEKFRQFLQQLRRHKILKKESKYAYAWELQKSGAIHFHIIFNLCLKFYKLQIFRLWTKLNTDNGALFFGQKLLCCQKKGEDQNVPVLIYLSKYISKFSSEATQREYKHRKVFGFSANCENIKKHKELIPIINGSRNRISNGWVLTTDDFPNLLFKATSILGGVPTPIITKEGYLIGFKIWYKKNEKK